MKNECYCMNKMPYQQCCEPIISGASSAQTAEQLMRSRYSAFVQQLEDYLRNTWHLTRRPSRVGFNSKQQWIGLTIKSTSKGMHDDETGDVEYVARFKIDGKAHRLHENSHFVKEDDQWFYVDGDFL